MKRVFDLMPAAIALLVLGGCVIVDKKPADSAPPPPTPTASATTTATATPTASATVTDAGVAPTASSTAAKPALKKPPARDAGTK